MEGLPRLSRSATVLYNFAAIKHRAWPRPTTGKALEAAATFVEKMKIVQDSLQASEKKSLVQLLKSAADAVVELKESGGMIASFTPAAMPLPADTELEAAGLKTE